MGWWLLHSIGAETFYHLRPEAKAREKEKPKTNKSRGSKNNQSHSRKLCRKSGNSFGFIQQTWAIQNDTSCIVSIAASYRWLYQCIILVAYHIVSILGSILGIVSGIISGIVSYRSMTRYLVGRYVSPKSAPYLAVALIFSQVITYVFCATS